jgi:hypothetical protein
MLNPFMLPDGVIVCQVGGHAINPANEPDGIVRLVNDQPMCSVHRLFLKPVAGGFDYGKKFLKPRKPTKKQLAELRAERDRENARVMEMAAASQEAAREAEETITIKAR